MSHRIKRPLSILLFGSITLLFAEVLSGSSITWFLTLPGLLITYPFYIVNSLLYLNIVYRWKRVSIVNLYFAGILYGAFEFWFTTVPLYGYINKTPVLGAFMGIAIFEYIALIYFWHPILSFIASISLYEFLILRSEETQEVSLNVHSFINASAKSHSFWFSIMVLGSFILTLYSSFNIVLYLTGYIGTLIIIFAIYSARRSIGGNLSIEDLILDDNSFKMLSFLVVVLYLIGFYYHTRFKIIHPEFIIIVVFTYILGLWGLKSCNKKGKSYESQINQVSNLGLHLLIPIIVGIILSLSTQISFQIGILLYLSLAPIGIGTLLFFLVKCLRSSKSS